MIKRLTILFAVFAIALPVLGQDYKLLEDKNPTLYWDDLQRMYPVQSRGIAPDGAKYYEYVCPSNPTAAYRLGRTGYRHDSSVLAGTATEIDSITTVPVLVDGFKKAAIQLGQWTPNNEVIFAGLSSATMYIVTSMEPAYTGTWQAGPSTSNVLGASWIDESTMTVRNAYTIIKARFEPQAKGGIVKYTSPQLAIVDATHTIGDVSAIISIRDDAYYTDGSGTVYNAAQVIDVTDAPGRRGLYYIDDLHGASRLSLVIRLRNSASMYVSNSSTVLRLKLYND